jgi:hypothetical protein
MAGPIESFMTADRARIDELLRAAERNGGTIDEATYADFRRALLRHIAMDEKVLLPFASTKRAGEPLEAGAPIHVAHAQIAKLLVSPPSGAVVSSLRALLAKLTALEEGPRGLYAACDDLAGDDASGVVGRLAEQPSVPVAQYFDGPLHGLV